MAQESISLSTRRPWLPPLSIATFVGVVLFLMYVGSALLAQVNIVPIWSALSGDLYPRNEEIRYCQQRQVESGGEANMLYLQPYGSLEGRLAAISAARDVGDTYGHRVVVVWNEMDDDGFVETSSNWNELFMRPEMEIGCFPGLARNERHAGCKVVDVTSPAQWQEVMEEKKDGPVCVKSTLNPSSKKVKKNKSFYEDLKPSSDIQDSLKVFESDVAWSSWGYWIGVSLSRRDAESICDGKTTENDDACANGNHKLDKLLSKYVNELRKVIDGVAADDDERRQQEARVLLLVDDEEIEDKLTTMLKTGIDELSGDGKLVAYNWYKVDNGKSRFKEEISNLWLQKRCQVVVSSDSDDISCSTAKLLGLPYCVSVNS